MILGEFLIFLILKNNSFNENFQMKTLQTNYQTGCYSNSTNLNLAAFDNLRKLKSRNKKKITIMHNYYKPSLYL